MMDTKRPNVVYIDCHDLGDWLGCYGRPYLRTPHLNQLAAEGAVFTQYMAAAPICQPGRTSIITGRMPHCAGVTGNQDRLDDDQICLPAYFRDAGYQTVLAGPMKLPNDPTWAGFERQLPASDQPLEDVAARFLLEEAANARPFFLSVSFQLIHRPYGVTYDPAVAERVAVPPPLPDIPIVRQDLAAQCYNVERLDACVGHILRAVKEAGLEDDTIVVFTTDHGVGIARAKHTLYDPGIQTALLLKYPPVVTAGARYGELLSNVDLLPTLLVLAGLPAPKDIDGRSFLALLRGSRFERRQEVFAEYTWGTRGGRSIYVPARCVRTERYKYIHNFTRQPCFIVPHWIARFRDDLTVVERLFSTPPPAEELYDLAADPHELHNLAQDPAHTEPRETLKQRLFTYLEESKDPILRGFVANKLGTSDDPQWIEQPDGSFRLSPIEVAGIREQPFP